MAQSKAGARYCPLDPAGGTVLAKNVIRINPIKESAMSSTLNPDEEPQQVVKQTSGTTGALGPSDSSDSGSDVAGAKRHEFDVDTELDNHALELGDAEMASDTDRAGTGERAAADGDSTLDPDSDIEPDRILTPPTAADDDDGLDEDPTGL
jgi:hypothetical protein